MTKWGSIALIVGLSTGGCGLTVQDLGSSMRGDGGADASDGDVAIPTTTTRLALGERHACAVHNGALVCWGREAQGQLGELSTDAVYFNGAENCLRSPRSAPGTEGIGLIAVGRDFTCGLRNGEVLCWGRNAFGELALGGMPDRNRHATPTPIRSNDRFSAIAAGRGHACAIRQGGQVLCWGLNHRRQLGVAVESVQRCPLDAIDRTELGITEADVPCTTSPVEVPGVADATELLASEYQTCARRSNGAFVCWGANEWAQLGTGTNEPADAPPTPIAMSNARTLAMGARHGCVIDTSNDVYCWGAETLGQTGLGAVMPSQCGTRSLCRAMPALVTTLRDARLLAAGGDRTCAVLGTGRVWCWGSNRANGLGLHVMTGLCGTEPCSTLPQQQRLPFNVRLLAMGRGNGCLVNGDDLVMCWGQNDFYQSGGGEDYLASGVEFPQEIYF